MQVNYLMFRWCFFEGLFALHNFSLKILQVRYQFTNKINHKLQNYSNMIFNVRGLACLSKSRCSSSEKKGLSILIAPVNKNHWLQVLQLYVIKIENINYGIVQTTVLYFNSVPQVLPIMILLPWYDSFIVNLSWIQWFTFSIWSYKL